MLIVTGQAHPVQNASAIAEVAKRNCKRVTVPVWEVGALAFRQRL
jgi:hypothetical protein